MTKLRVYFPELQSEGDSDLQTVAMREYMDFVPQYEAEVIYCASIDMMNYALSAKRSTGKPLVTYCWDYYLWAHNNIRKGGNPWDWKRYADMLIHCDLIFVPSAAQQRRLKELLNLDSTVVHTGIRRFEGIDVRDDGFILDPLRYYPEEASGWAEKAANELGIPVVHSEHAYTDDEFRKLLATCSFMTCCVSEASTGGLSLMEGLWLGKPSLVSDSPYQGARDYLGDLGYYFTHDSYDSLVRTMKMIWDRRPTISQATVERHMKDYSFELMAKNLYEGMRRVV